MAQGRRLSMSTPAKRRRGDRIVWAALKPPPKRVKALPVVDEPPAVPWQPVYRERADLSPEVNWYLKSRGYTLPDWCVPAIRTPEPNKHPGAVFDAERVDKVIAGLRCLRHTQGKWAGRELAPDAWQVAYILAPVFGWVAPDDDGNHVRIVRNTYIEIPRKNGKTSLLAGLLLYLAFADGEAGAQVLAVAGSKDQARLCFDPAAQIARSSPDLKSAGIRALQSRIVQQSTNSYFAVAASIGDLLHGTNIHAAGIDELHVHKTADVVDAVESGTGSRSQPLVITITTADDGRPNSVYAAKRDYIERLARGGIKQPSVYGVVFAADPLDDPFAESTWMTANPGYGVSPTKSSLAVEASKAQQNPVNLARFLRLHLGIRTRQETKYFELPVWDRNASMVNETRLRGRMAFGGLDLASTSDLTALCWLFPDLAAGYDAIWRFWTPQANVRKLDDRTAGAATSWVKLGYLRLTPGEVTDYAYVRDQIVRDLATFKVRELAYDPWNATQLVTDLQSDGAPMVTVRQGFASLSPPMKQLSRLLLQGTAEKPKMRHGANPVMRWMVDNVAVAQDPSGNVKPDRARSADKIDGVSALVTALSRAMVTGKPRRSAYEDSDVIDDDEDQDQDQGAVS
jgi:phage terminase large subunit-like protein